MITEIHISGQISGNSTLKNALPDATEIKKGMFYGWIMVYPTKKAAKKALWQAYRKLVADEPNFKHGIKYLKGSTIFYDASKAVILES